MAYDQNNNNNNINNNNNNVLPNNNLRPIQMTRPIAADEPPRIALPTSSPGSIPVYYPATAPAAVPDSGYVSGLSYGNVNVVPSIATSWLPRMPPAPSTLR